MILVVDTNIFFSSLINPKSNIGEILINPSLNIDFFAPELLAQELDKYYDKLLKASKLNQKQLSSAVSTILKRVKLISFELISENTWLDAYELIKEIDENDVPFIALALEMRAKLWTGDKKLIDGLKNKNQFITHSTDELISLLT